MRIHANARTCPNSRKLLVKRIEEEGWSLMVAASGEDVTVVFERPPSPPISSPVVETAHAPRPGRDSADQEIARLLRDDPDPEHVRVVTSDRALADQARFLGATVEPAKAFRRRLEGEEI